MGEGQLGLLVVPPESEVRKDFPYDGGTKAKTGDCVVPAARDVQQGVPVDVSDSGSFVPPAAATGELGTPYGHDGEFNGTLNIEARANLPDESVVLDTARGIRFPAYLAAVAHQMFMMTSAAGHGRLDDTAVVKMYEALMDFKVVNKETV